MYEYFVHLFASSKRKEMIGKKKRKEKRPIECTDSFHSGDIYTDCKQKRTMIALRRKYYVVYY